MGDEESAPTTIQQQQQQQEEKDVVCEFCSKSKAVMYCRADTARLCLACDRHVHSANTVSSKHPRSLLCDLCRSAPSSLLCCSHGDGLLGLLLCSDCDFEVHNSKGLISIHDHDCGIGTNHDRRAVEQFSGCPTAEELVSLLGVGGDDVLLLFKKNTDGDDTEIGLVNLRPVWETGQVVRLDDLIVPTSSVASTHPLQFQPMAMGIPPPPKNRNLAFGEQKEEILQQLRELITSETQLVYDDQDENETPITELLQYFTQQNCHQQDNLLLLDFNVDATFAVTPYSEPSEIQWNNIDWQNATDHPSMIPPNFDDGQFESYSAPISDNQTSSAICPATGNSTDTGDHVDIVEEYVSQQLTPTGGVELWVHPGRDSVLSRYKEKRKTRRYDKLIRYESRKTRADSRVRIKGRFVKAIKQVPNF